MDKRIILCIFIIIFFIILGVIFFHFFEIVPEKEKISPSREYYSNNFLALERWFKKAGIPITKQNEFEFDIFNENNLQKTIFLADANYFFYDYSEEDIIQSVKNGKNIIFCLTSSDLVSINDLASELFSSLEITLEYAEYSDERLDSDDNFPDFHWGHKFKVGYIPGSRLYYDINENIRMVRIAIGEGSLTVLGIPIFMYNDNIGKEVNARLTWELLAIPSDKNGIMIIEGYKEKKRESSLFGTLMKRGNIIPVIASVLILIIFGFWMVIPVFGKLIIENERVSRPIKDRFLAEIGFLKKYKGLYYYDESINKIRSDYERNRGS